MSSRCRAAALLLLPLLLSLVACSDMDVPVALPERTEMGPSDYRLEVVASTGSAQTGQPVFFSVTLLDPEGVDVTGLFDIRTEVAPSLGVIVDGDAHYRFTRVDTFSYFASVDVEGVSLVAAAPVVVSAGPAAELDIRVDPPLVEAGSPVTIVAEATDGWGNPVLIPDGAVAFTVDPPASLSGNQVVATTVGSYKVHGELTGTTGADLDTFLVVPADPASLDISLSAYDVERDQGVVVTSDVRDAYGNEVDIAVELSTDPVPGSLAWGDFVRFPQEGIYWVHADLSQYGLHAEDGPVVVDSTGPSIRVTSPQRGDEIESALYPTVQVTGTVADPWTGVVSLVINGESLSLAAGGGFSYPMNPVPGLNVIEIVAEDGDGNVSDLYQTFLWGDFLPMGQASEDALLARLNEGAMDVVSDYVSDEFLADELGSSLTTNLYTSPTWCLNFWIAEVCGYITVDVNGVDWSEIDFVLDPMGPTGSFPRGYLDFQATVWDFEIIITPAGNFYGSALFGAVTWGPDVLGFDGVVGTERLQLDTEVGLEVIPDPDDPTRNIIEPTLENTVIDVDDLYIDLSDLGLLGEIVGTITTWILQLFEPLFDLLLGPLVEDQLPDLLADVLSEIRIETDIDLLGATIGLEAQPQEIEIDDDGMTIVLESSASTTPGPTAASTLGAVQRTDSVWPSYALTPDFDLSMADNFLNQLMHAVWQAGVMDFSMNASDLGIELSSLGEVLPLTTLEFETEPLLPPTMVAGSSGGTELHIGDMLVNVYGDPGRVYEGSDPLFEGDEPGDCSDGLDDDLDGLFDCDDPDCGGADNCGLMMQLAVTVIVSSELEIDSNDEIQFALGEPEVIMDFVHSDPWDLDGEGVEDLMNAIVDLIVPTLVSTLDGVGGIPIPELADFVLDSPSIAREAAPAYYITASGNLTTD